MSVAFVNIKNTVNTGDVYCTPYHYFDFPDARWFDFGDKIPPSKVIIFGGGAIEPRLRSDRFHDLVEAEYKVGWGIGTSRSGMKDPGVLVNDLDLCGVREFDRLGTKDAGAEYVPCVSCMSPLFDMPYREKNDVVVYKHAVKDLPSDLSKFPMMNNRAPFDEVIEFLGTSNCVITNSFHGVYWATLLGKKVVCLPFSSKFYGFKFPPFYAKPNCWQEGVENAISYKEALEDCRNINRDFYKKVLALCGS